MTPQGSPVPAAAAPAFERAIRVADLLAVDPAGLGGVLVRARAGPVREAWLAACRDRLSDPSRLRKIPLNISEDRLIGGLDLAETLRQRRPVLMPGLITGLDGGVGLLPMAERTAAATLAHLAAALDQGEVVLERDGFAGRLPARFAVLALDEGAGPDEAVAPALSDRLAFHVDLDAVAVNDAAGPPAYPAELRAARRRLPDVGPSDEVIAALMEVASALGVASLRAPLFALRAARAAAALAGRTEVLDDDVRTAVQLVLAPRATRLPAPPAEPETESAEDGAQDEAEASPGEAPSESEARRSAGPPAEMLVEAAVAAIRKGSSTRSRRIPCGAARLVRPGSAPPMPRGCAGGRRGCAAPRRGPAPG